MSEHPLDVIRALVEDVRERYLVDSSHRAFLADAGDVALSDVEGLVEAARIVIGNGIGEFDQPLADALRPFDRKEQT